MSLTKTQEDTSRPFRLMVGELAPADAARAQAFVSLGSRRLRQAWTLVGDAAGPVHAVLTGMDDPPTIPCALDHPIVHLRVWRPAPGSDMPDGVLRSPLQFDDLVDALAHAEAVLRGPADTPAPQPATPNAAHDGAPAREDAWAGVRFRLRRWPSAGLLQDARYGIRLASFMSSRFLTLDELQKLSNVSHAECAGVVQRFMDQGLLHVQRTAPAAADASAAPPATATPAPQTQPPSAVPAPRAGLLAALRRRLGLALSR